MKTKEEKIAENIIKANGACYQNVFITDPETQRKYKYSVGLGPCGDGYGLTVTMEPYRPASTARARGMIDYAYDMGGSTFKAATDFAREIERLLPSHLL